MKQFSLSMLLIAVLVCPAISQVSLTNLSAIYNQDFNTLANSGTANSTVPTGWLFTETGTGANAAYAADNGGLNSGNTYSYGATGNTERAFGGLQSNAVNPTIGVAFTNNSGAIITSFNVGYTGEQWRLGAAGRADTLHFQYSTNATSLTTGTWSDVNPLDFVSPNTTAAAGPLDGNATSNKATLTFTLNGLSIANGTTFYLRWVDANVASSDDGLAVDDFSISFNGASQPACTVPAAQPGNLTFGTISNTSISGNFSAASPAADRYIVIISTSNSLTALPQDGTAYSDDDVIGNGTVITTTNGSTFTASNLMAGTTYYVYVFSLNSNCTGGPLYNTAAPLTGSAATTSPPACAAPASAPGAITTNSAGTSINGSFAPATGADGYLVVRSLNSSMSFTPVNGTTYSVGQTVGGTSDGTVIKFGDGTAFATNGLTINTTYYFYVYAVSNFTCTGGPFYNTTPSTASATTTNSATGEPAGYYATASGKNCEVLKTTLKDIITSGNTLRSYGDLWAQYTVSDVKPREIFYASPNNTANVIWDIYSDNPTATDPYNFTPGGSGSRGQCGNYSNESDCYNREHSFPQNWFTGGTATGPGTDYHHIFPTDGKVNGVRANYIYGEVTSPTYTSLNGSKLGPSTNAGFNGPVFEPINEYKGDLARAFLYMVTRYEANMPTWGNITNSNGLQALEPNTYPSVDVPYLQLMIKWHNQDPVSQKEIDRNNAGYTFQNNRNPFVDHPEYVAQVWNNGCVGLSTLPVELVSFKGRLNGNNIVLEWIARQEINFDRFEVERSVNGTTYTTIGSVKAANLHNYSFVDDADNLRGQRVYYRLKKVDRDGRFTYSLVFTVHIPFNTKFTVYPNPAKNSFQLQLNKNVNGKVTISLSDVTGKILQQQSLVVSGNTVTIRTQNIQSGTYFVRLTYNGEKYLQRIIIAR